ncbi:hypothetical protein FSP39_018097 [Pinctada imbricata]|uniref:Phosphatidylcholine transfer protein n=1 Tax=Pinctada imbricata TaxID=66713 RepID=A0AA88YB00_PINIB|nr:hypothetical protein FSP39_018097 [Pinctada imbricata]
MNRNILMIAESVARQCNGIASQRVRRASQILTLYKKLYGEKAMRRVLNNFRTSFSRKHHGSPVYFMIGACLFAWDKEKVTDKEMKSVIDDMSKVRNAKVDHGGGGDTDYLASWEEVVNKEHIKIWRQPLEGTHLHEYKVYGSYYDIPASVFFQIQVDLEYRKTWDAYLVDLNVVDRDKESGCEVVHWVTKYPVTWTGREYVYIRRYTIDEDKKVMALVSRAVDHPACPNTDKYVRVTQYESIMVIKPHTDFNQKGFDYVMTYYDDPQIMFSSQAFKFAKFIGVNFVDSIHKAAKDLYDNNQSTKNNNASVSTNDSSSWTQQSGDNSNIHSSYNAQKQYS